MTGGWLIPRVAPERPPLTFLVQSHRGAMLAECLASLDAQTVKDCQVLVNHCATWWGDKMNDLARIARARWLCPICEDDLVAPNFAAKCLDATRLGDPLVYTDIQMFGDSSNVVELPNFGINTFRQMPCPWTTALIDKRLWDDLGGYDPEQDYQDTEFYIRAAKAGATGAHIREPLFLAREWKGNGHKRMNHADAVLKIQGKHPDVYPDPFSRAPVARLHVPARLQEA